MSASTLLETLQTRGVTLRAAGDVIKYKPPGLVSEAERAEIIAQKTELLRLLSLGRNNQSPTQAVGGTTEYVAEASDTHGNRVAAHSPIPFITSTCSLCGQPSRSRCRYQGYAGMWIAWCDNDECARADIVSERANDEKSSDGQR
jgi:hypothetical protein